jgi:hypothetical protein
VCAFLRPYPYPMTAVVRHTTLVGTHGRTDDKRAVCMQRVYTSVVRM